VDTAAYHKKLVTDMFLSVLFKKKNANCLDLIAFSDQAWITGGMTLTSENLSAKRKAVPMSFCPPKIPYGPTWDRSWSSIMTG